MQDVKENFRNYRSSPMYAQNRSNVHEIGHTLLSILKVLGTIILVIIGIPILFAGAILLIVLFSLLFASHQVLTALPFSHGFNVMEFLYTPGASLTWITIGIALVVGIPLVMLIYAGIKMIFRIKSNNHIFGSAFAGLFLVGLFILFISGSRTIGEFSKQGTFTQHEKITAVSDTLYISSAKNQAEKELEEMIDPELDFNRFKVGSLNGKEVLIGGAELRIERNDDSSVDLIVNKLSRGANLSSARQNAEEIQYNYQIKDSLLTLPSVYLLPKIWRNQHVNLKLKIPVGKTIFLDESVRSILHDIKNTSDTWDDDMVNKYWTMKPEGLTLVNRALPNSKPAKK